ncbi:HAD family hydrolase [Mycobacterium shimoidei]|uniref:HAD family hydrolase n=1 Tax=Mycobacterium shimoidei TaxID=29313 RepID=UPI0008486ABF|nr:HAD family phosphatase [Mycobacterium shimoidei]MCV7259302.1 HAD family phosphatase [Mycobacterium shimoidei]ODR13352.1 haloacid dehalogenase [Mycobacterium shimoidei]ORW79691.1 haloacid dehalogenase [Mycobacterium shimoidei]
MKRNQQRLAVIREFDPASITTLLCDADDNLFASEAPAFDASVEVTNRFLARFGVSVPLSADELRKKAVGKNFRSTALDLAVLCEVPLEQTLAEDHPAAVVASDNDVAAGRALCADELEQWVRQEREHVTAHLAATLSPDPQVAAALRSLASRYRLAAVSSSALARLDACFAATGLDQLIPANMRFSAEDSLQVPTSKPDPAVYLHAGEVMDIGPRQGLAIEDSVAGVTSAVAAGYLTVGNLFFVPDDERACRRAELADAGAHAIAESWSALTDALLAPAVK